jgi:hypothetical protein
MRVKEVANEEPSALPRAEWIGLEGRTLKRRLGLIFQLDTRKWRAEN